jgi:hypothetical protein
LKGPLLSLLKKLIPSDARAFETDFLSTYYDAFVDTAAHLRMKVPDFRLEHLVADFKKFELAGVLCAAAATADDTFQVSIL